MSKKIKKLIKKTRHRLQWPVCEVTGSDIHTLMITSDHHCRTHTIDIPDSDVRDIEYLHELAHAALCESIHPQFSTQHLVGADMKILRLLQPACQAASDWFADAWLMQVCPDEERAEIDEHCAMICHNIQTTPNGTPEKLYGAALMIAQANKYCRRDIKTGGVLDQVVGVFLDIEPWPPTIGKLEKLVNGLLAALYPHRVRLVKDEWEVYKI